MKDVILLTDYKNFFGSKQKSKIYRGGMDLSKITDLFRNYGYKTKILNFSELNFYNIDRNSVILYTSSEDLNSLYKSYIEDIILDLELRNFFVIPKFEYLRAHNNKVAMELLRNRSNFPDIQTIKSFVFGTYEELISNLNKISYPVIIKKYSGAMSKGVAKADNEKELLKITKKFSKSFNFKHDFKEILRKIKYRNKYIKESSFRNKFVIQNYIEGLDEDWKVLVYGDRCYVLNRKNRKNDFRASGSGNFKFIEDLPDGLLDFAYNIKNFFNVPNISLDIGFDGNQFHLFEFQFLYFGTTTLEKSSFYFIKKENSWQIIHENSDLEEVYVYSIINFFENNK